MMVRNSIFLAGMLVLALVLAVPVSADTMTKNAGDGQTGVVHHAVTPLPSVTIMNGTTPVAGVDVTFTVSNGGGSVTGSSTTETKTTDTNGIATVGTWVLGNTAGSNTLTATATSSGSSLTATFTATGTAGPATQIVKNVGDGQSATVETEVTTRPSVKVMDEFNNPVTGATVEFLVTTPANSYVTGPSQQTGSDGIATVGSWKVGPIAGQNNLKATISGTAYSVFFTATGTESANAPTITTISPSVGLNTGTTSAIGITGTYFSSTGVKVNLTRSNRANITGTCTRNSATSLTCSFPLTGADGGSWNVVVTNADGKAVTKSGGFTIVDESDTGVSITSISPATAMAGDDFTFTITGKDFITTMVYEVYLYNSDYDENITAEDITVPSATSIKGKFDLTSDTDVDTYYVCIKDSFGGIECKKNLFTITTNKVGSIEINSKPDGATIFINDVANGTTPKTVDDIIIGSYKVTLKKAGYSDWTKTVKVEEDDTTIVDATMYAAPATTPPSTTVRTQAPSTTQPAGTPARTLVKSTIKIPTTLAETPEPTEESPVEPVFVICAVCLALIALRKR